MNNNEFKIIENWELIKQLLNNWTRCYLVFIYFQHSEANTIQNLPIVLFNIVSLDTWDSLIEYPQGLLKALSFYFCFSFFDVQ